MLSFCYNARVEIHTKKLKDEAVLPSFAHLGDAGADLYAVADTVLPSQSRGLVPTGIAMEIPEGYVGLIWDKSGLAVKSGITTMAGVIDAGYRGEIGIAIFNTTTEPYTFRKGDKVAQILIQKTEHPLFIESDAPSETKRSDGAFGSTGK